MIDKNPLKIRKMFDEISSKYNFMNNLISLGLHRVIKRCAINELEIPYGVKILDCCTGTGDIPKLIKEKKPEAKITAIDFSPKMLKIARKNVKDVEFIQSDCTFLPFYDSEFSIITIFFGLRNIEKRQSAIVEMKRVLKTDGQLLHLDFGKNKIPDCVFTFVVWLWAKIFMKNTDAYEYLLNSKEEFLSSVDLIKEFEHNGFRLKKEKKFLFGTIAMQIFTK